MYLKQTFYYKQDWVASMFKVQLQVLDKFMAESDFGFNGEASNLVGDLLSAGERENIRKGVPNVRVFADICTLWLAVHFGELEVAKKMLKATRDIKRYGNVCFLGVSLPVLQEIPTR